MQVTAQQVNELRQKTGAGMSKCKEALVATSGDLNLAIQWLRNQGHKPEKLTRLTGEGIVCAKANSEKAVVFSLRCETDFSARNTRFSDLASKIADDFLTGGQISSTTEGDLKFEMASGIGENITVGTPKFHVIDKNVALGNYTHSNNKLATLVAISFTKAETPSKPEFTQLLKDVAMHIAGANPEPKASTRELLAKELVAKEQEFVAGQCSSDASFAKKPENIRQKIVEGKMGKFYKENVLIEQNFVKDESQTVDQHIKEVAKKCSDQLQVLWFFRHQLSD